MAGMTSKLVEHPFDTIKVRLQTQTTLAPSSSASSAKTAPPPTKIFSGPWDCFRKTVKMEGFMGLYQVHPHIIRETYVTRVFVRLYLAR